MDNQYRMSKAIEDTIQAPTHYDAYLEFRKRQQEGYYGITPGDVEFIREVYKEESLSLEE